MGILDQAAGQAGMPVPTAAPTPAPAQPMSAGQPASQSSAPPQPMSTAEQVGMGSNSGGKASEGMAPNIKEEQATPEEQAEYERAMLALTKVLYANEQTSKAIVDQINPEDKVDTTSKAAMLVINQLDQKVDLDEIVVAQITQESVARIIELAETRYNTEYDDREQQAILGTVWEGVQTMFGVEPEDTQQAAATVGADNMGALKQTYEAALNG